MMEFRRARTHLKSTIIIHNIISMYYFEYGKDFKFNGEQHDFWEFLYVDKGEIDVWADDTLHHLKQGMVIFHKPNEFHSFHANKSAGINLIVITFDSSSPMMGFFERRMITLQDEERNLLAQIVKEGANAFLFPIKKYPLTRRSQGPIAAEQMIRLYLEMFFIRLLRKGSTTHHSASLSSPAKEKDEANLASAIVDYLENHLDAPVSLTELSLSLHVTKNKLKDVFRKKYGSGIIQFSSQLKLEKAKLFIREESYNMTEIARKLGFSNIHYFSKSFKRKTNMSPTEYAKSVKARM